MARWQKASSSAGRALTGRTIPAFLQGIVANSFRTIADYMDIQITGGSSAVRFTGVYGMRVTAAAAREMLVKAAAARWKVSPDELHDKDEPHCSYAERQELRLRRTGSGRGGLFATVQSGAEADRANTS